MENISATQACPMCGEEIKTAAQKCKHCGEFFAKTVTTASTVKSQSQSSSTSSLITYKPGLSLGLGISSIVFSGLIGNILATGAFVLGHKALDAIKLEPNLSNGNGKALGGLICGYIGIATSAIWITLWVFIIS